MGDSQEVRQVTVNDPTEGSNPSLPDPFATMSVDSLGRFPISDALKSDLNMALNGIEPGRRGALLFVADTDTMTARTQVAAKLGDHWKVAGGIGFDFRNIKAVPTAQVVVMGSW